jgi:hypothetical protein
MTHCTGLRSRSRIDGDLFRGQGMDFISTGQIDMNYRNGGKVLTPILPDLLPSESTHAKLFAYGKVFSLALSWTD